MLPGFRGARDVSPVIAEQIGDSTARVGDLFPKQATATISVFAP
jgi:hypothetical protein